MDKKITIIIPAYNEERTLAGTVNKTIGVVKGLEGFDYELVIVDDGSTDSTYQVLEELKKQAGYNIKIKSHFPNRGKGSALKEGVALASGDYMLFMDADLEIDPGHMLDFLGLLLNSGADAVAGSKVSKNSQTRLSLKRRILSLGYYSIIKLLFRLPVIDTQTGFKLFKREPLIDCIGKTSINGYSFDLELLLILKAHKYRVIACPVKIDALRSRRIELSDSLPMIRDTFRIFKKYYFTRSYN